MKSAIVCKMFRGTFIFRKLAMNKSESRWIPTLRFSFSNNKLIKTGVITEVSYYGDKNQKIKFNKLVDDYLLTQRISALYQNMCLQNEEDVSVV